MRSRGEVIEGLEGRADGAGRGMALLTEWQYRRDSAGRRLTKAIAMIEISNGAKAYIRRDMKRVEGWLSPLTAELLAAIGAKQSQMGVLGAVGEIGVHHGKSWLVLDHVAKPDEPRFAIDVFDLQALNTDRSGKGDQAQFERNRQRFGAGGRDPVIIRASSFDVTVDALRDAVGAVRLFSIDGGHTRECTLNDLRLAAGVLADAGVIVLDDVFNPRFAGVVNGLFDYIQSGECDVTPLCISPGKVFFARPDVADAYIDMINEKFASNILSRVVFVGREIPTLMGNGALARRGKAIFGGTPIEPFARRLFSMVSR